MNLLKTKSDSTQAGDRRELPKTRSGGQQLASPIYEEVRKRICTLKYPPGELLRESELAEEFCVSRTPIRQVFQKLQSQGLVETKNGVGTIVTIVDFNTFKDVYDFRLELAELIGRLSPNECTASHWEAMEKLLERADALRQRHDTEALWNINYERQKIIDSLIGNEALRQMYDLYYYQTSSIWFQLVDEMWEEQVEALCSELRDLIRVMKAGDTKAIAYTERNHLSLHLVMIKRFHKGEND